MRIFSAFGILGLLHVARGGELDSFASDRARQIRDTLHARNSPGVSSSDPYPGNSSTPTSTELPPAFQKAQERSELHKRAVDRMDTNGDDYVDTHELVKQFEFFWGDAKTVHRILRTFGFSDLAGAVKEYTGDTRISKRELVELAESRPHEGSKSTSHCPALRTKIESCHLHNVMSCSNYLNAAESFCNTSHKSIVETCIMSESCWNICKCIEAAEKAAHGEGAAIVIVDQQGVTTDPFNTNAVGFPEAGMQPHEKRFGIFAFIAWAILGLVWATIIDVVLKEWTRYWQESRWMNSVSWDKSGPEPACSVYVFWGNCGAIGSGKARNCPDGAERVYGNSCKDHFRYGSRGCDFLDLGCQSMCTKVNPKGCPCSMFDWAEFDDQDMPGFDIPNSSFFTTVVSECRDACAKNSQCQAFVMTPAKGNVDESPNCWLKNAQRLTARSDGATTFFKKGLSNAKCGAPLTSTGAYDNDWWIDDDSTKRSELAPRARKGDKLPFLYNRNAADYYLAYRFLQVLYQVAGYLTRERTLIDYPRLQQPVGDTAINRDARGNGIPRSEGRPTTDEAPYISYPAFPQWRAAEIGYRVTTVFRGILALALATNVDDPVTQYLTNNAPTGQGGTPGTAQYPQSVRNLLAANSAIVHAQSRSQGETWMAMNQPVSGKVTPPFAGVQAGYDTRLTYWQSGNAGPFSLEAAFILATQMAGVNFRAVARAAERSTTGDPWWIGVMTPNTNSGECLNEEDAEGNPIRQYGRYMPSSGNNQHSADAGVYTVFDLDPSSTDPDRAVFVFVVHAVDRNSVIRVPNEGYLSDINLTRYTPATGVGKDESLFWNGGSSSATRPTFPASSGNPGTRLFHSVNISAHSHAAIIRLSDLNTWLQSTGSQRFPTYVQIGSQHLYILTEDYTGFPRNDWLNRQPPPPPGGAGTAA